MLNEYFFLGAERVIGKAVDGEFLLGIEYWLGERLFMLLFVCFGEEWWVAQQLMFDSFTILIVLVILGLGLVSLGGWELCWFARDRCLGVLILLFGGGLVWFCVLGVLDFMIGD